MKKMLSILIIMLLGLSNSLSLASYQGSSSTDTNSIRIQESKRAGPILSVVKKVDKKEIRYDERVSITIIIENNSNATAYNISTKETEIPAWAFNVTGNANASWKLLKPNQTIAHRYYLTPKIEQDKNVSLGKAKVIWYSGKGGVYKGYSEERWLKIQYSQRIGKDWGKIWRDSLIAVTLIFACIVASLIYIEVSTFRKYKKTTS